LYTPSPQRRGPAHAPNSQDLLACAVDRSSRAHHGLSGQGGDVDHTQLSGSPGRASGQLDGQDGARQVKGGAHVEVEPGVDVLGDLLDEVSAFTTSCVVDEQVDRCGVPATV